MQENSGDFVCFGALNADICYMVEKLPGEDDETFIIDTNVSSGGSAANTASALAFFGNNVAFFGRAGRDEYGKMLVEELERWGVKPVVSFGERSGKAVVLVDRDGRRAILVDPGANDEVEDVDELIDYARSNPHLHLTSFVCRKSDSPFKAQIKAAKLFDRVSLDPGAIYAERKDVWELIEECTIFMPNTREIEKICGCSYRKASELVLRRMRENGVVVVKLGEKGCFATDGRREVKVEAFRVKAVDTTGAGDAFNAGFLHAWARGYDLERCLKAGNFVASYNVQHYGARNFPRREEVEEFLGSL